MTELLEFLLEFALQVAGDLLLDGLSRSPVVRTIGFSAIAAVFGLLLGALSIAIYDHHMVTDPTLRIVSLCVMPVANGFLMMRVGHYFESKEKPRSGFER